MRGTNKFYYGAVKSEFGEIVVVWRFTDDKIIRVFLPEQCSLFNSSEYKICGIGKISNRIASASLRKIDLLLEGQPVDLSLGIIDWSTMHAFQKRVLRMEYKIPRGWVSTYGRIAKKLGNAGAARAVGRALATNPFPLVIPCHRAVRSDGSLGGYAGGIAMKKKLLELEGIEFDGYGRVINRRFW